MPARGADVRQKVESLSSLLDDDCLMELSVSACDDASNAGNDLDIPRDEIQLGRIGQQLKDKKVAEVPELSAQSLESLRGPARQLKEAKARLAEAEKEYESAKVESAEAENELEAELERRGCQNLDDSLDVSGRMVNRLRKRVQLDDNALQ